jgi:signal transduction histidine kinase
MSPLSPRATLLLLLGLAVVILGAGLRLARVEERVRVNRDREALRRFASDAQIELERLEALYDQHLADLGYLTLLRLPRNAPGADTFPIRHAAGRWVGIRQYSLLTKGGKPGSDLHLLIAASPTEHTPLPTFAATREDTGKVLLLSPDPMFSENGPTSGWINNPGQPLIFWSRITSSHAMVLLIDRREVEQAVTQWLQFWAEHQFTAVRAGGGPDELRTSAGRPVVTVGANDNIPPDLLLPLRSRLGSWELASWDRRETHVHYSPSVLAASSVLAVFVGLLALLVFSQQRRAAVLAAQRVSFVNSVSHELRTPLTNILLNLDLAAEAMTDAPRDATRRLRLVHEEARRLGRLIDNVLTFSRHEQGKLRAEPRACVPASVIAAVVEQFAPSFARRALEVRCTGNATTPCLLDADALAQVLANLLSNVEKYVPGGLVEIRANSDDDGALSLTVADQGPGIPPEAAERIFRPFERLESRLSEGASGTGLGLAIARDLAATMGGTLRLLPTTNHGALFELRVPAPPAPPLTSVSTTTAA